MAFDLPYDAYEWDPAGRGFRQRDLTVRVRYDRDYVLSRYAGIDARVRELSARRLAVLEAFVPGPGNLLDFGCGTGRFVEAASRTGWDAFGHDLWPCPGVRLLARDELRDHRWRVVTFFDSLEHLPDPATCVAALDPKCVMVSVPWCHRPDDEAWFMSWRHRRPGEHLWHWGRESLDRLFGLCGYRPVMHSSFEDEHRPNPGQLEPNVLTAIYVR